MSEQLLFFYVLIFKFIHLLFYMISLNKNICYLGYQFIDDYLLLYYESISWSSLFC